MLSSSGILTEYSCLTIQQLHGIAKSVFNQNLVAFMSYIYIVCVCVCVCVWACHFIFFIRTLLFYDIKANIRLSPFIFNEHCTVVTGNIKQYLS